MLEDEKWQSCTLYITVSDDAFISTSTTSTLQVPAEQMHTYFE